MTLTEYQVSVLTALSNTKLGAYVYKDEPEFEQFWELVQAALLVPGRGGLLYIRPEVALMFKDAGLRRVN